MIKEESKRRIKYAYFLEGWSPENGSGSVLKEKATRVTPSDYSEEMDGSIFCPVCFTNLNRVPKEKDHFSNGRDAFFAHIKTYKDIKCDLRSTKPEGKRYETQREAQKVIDDQNLVIVSGFMEEEPIEPQNNNKEYDETPVEDEVGLLSDVPISRHTGESSNLPSIITTVAGICRSFDDNLYKYYCFPGQTFAIQLVDYLRSIETVKEEDDIPRLYYGVIINSFNAGFNPKPKNIRMTKLSCHINVHDFYLKATDRVSVQKGITDDSKGRIVLMYGKVSKSGKGLCLERLKWGEFALLPEKYNALLLQAFNNRKQCDSFSVSPSASLQYSACCGCYT